MTWTLDPGTAHLMSDAVVRGEQVARALPQVALHFVFWLIAALVVNVHECALHLVQGFHL